SRLPDGEGIENRTIRYDSEDYLGEYYDPASEAIDYYFVADELFSSRNFDITFDENRMIKSWAFNNNVYPSTDKAFYTITNNYDRQIDSWYYGSAADYRARTVLDSLGYKEGTGAYNDLYCGSWAGRAAGCGIIGEPADAWAAYYMAEGGMWFTDPIGFALQVEAVTKAALANPPVSYHDIAAVPVPAPLGLLAVGIAALGL